MMIWAIAAPILWAAIVFLLHVVKIPQEQSSRWNVPHADKVVHFTMFGILSFLCWRSWMFLKEKRNQLQWMVVFIISVSYGALLEWIQSVSGTERDSDFFDWLADLSGTAIGLWLASTQLLSILFGHQFRETSKDFR